MREGTSWFVISSCRISCPLLTCQRPWVRLCFTSLPTTQLHPATLKTTRTSVWRLNDDQSRTGRLCCHTGSGHMGRGHEVQRPQHRQDKGWGRSYSRNGFGKPSMLGQRGEKTWLRVDWALSPPVATRKLGSLDNTPSPPNPHTLQDRLLTASLRVNSGLKPPLHYRVSKYQVRIRSLGVRGHENIVSLKWEQALSPHFAHQGKALWRKEVHGIFLFLSWSSPETPCAPLDVSP